MKTKILKPFFSLLVVVAAIVLAACAEKEPPAPSELGKWEHTTDVGSLEFKADGEVVMVDNMRATVVGTYLITPDGEMRLELTKGNIMQDSIELMDEPIEITARYFINEDTLTLSFDGQADVFRRVE